MLGIWYLFGMGRITIIANALLMFLFWLASELAIALAYNHFVRYPATEGVLALPLPTHIAFAMRELSAVVPLVWCVVSFVFYRYIRRKPGVERQGYLLVFTLATVIAGFSMLIFFGLAGILPYLRIGTVLG